MHLPFHGSRLFFSLHILFHLLLHFFFNFDINNSAKLHETPSQIVALKSNNYKGITLFTYIQIHAEVPCSGSL